MTISTQRPVATETQSTRPEAGGARFKHSARELAVQCAQQAIAGRAGGCLFTHVSTLLTDLLGHSPPPDARSWAAQIHSTDAKAHCGELQPLEALAHSWAITRWVTRAWLG